MKTKLLLTGIVSATLLLGACGNDESEKKDDSKKSESVEKKKDNDKKEDAKKAEAKKEDKSNEQNEQASTEESNTQEQQSQEVAQKETTEQEQREANVEWNRQNVEGGTDAGMLDPSAQPNEYYSNDQLDPETGLPKDDAVPRKAGEEPTEEEIAEAQKDALREKYNGGLSSGEIQTKHAIEQGYYDGDDADEVMNEIEKSEQEIAEGKYDQYKE